MAKHQRHDDDFKRAQIERLLVAAELYVVAVIRHGLRPSDDDAAKVVAIVRSGLLDEVEAIGNED